MGGNNRRVIKSARKSVLRSAAFRTAQKDDEDNFDEEDNEDGEITPFDTLKTPGKGKSKEGIS